MIDKVQKIREEIERLMYGFNLEADIASCEDAETEKLADIKYQVCKKLLDYIDSMQEEPVSDGLEEAAFGYAEACKYDGGEKLLCVEHFKAGAKWQKTQEYTCYEEAFEDGAKWKKEKTIDKACKWIEEKAARYLVDRFVDSMRITGIDTSIIEDFRKAMEE